MEMPVSWGLKAGLGCSYGLVRLDGDVNVMLLIASISTMSL